MTLAGPDAPSSREFLPSAGTPESFPSLTCPPRSPPCSLHFSGLPLRCVSRSPLVLLGFSRLYNSSSRRVLVSTPQTPPWNSAGRGRRAGDPDRFRLAAGWATGDPADGRRSPAGPGAPVPHLLPPAPTRDLAREREGIVSARGVSGLRQKCGLGGQGWRRGGGALASTSPGDWSRIEGRRDKGKPPGFLPSPAFWAPRIPKAISQEA